jgi:hypothetical protein
MIGMAENASKDRSTLPGTNFHVHTDRQTDRQTYIQTDRQKTNYRQTCIHT